jgi:hypothetical protein
MAHYDKKKPALIEQAFLNLLLEIMQVKLLQPDIHQRRNRNRCRYQRQFCRYHLRR